MSYGGDVNRGPFLDIIDWVFCSIALAVVTLRLASGRLLEKKRWELDDGLIALSMALVLARAIYLTVCIDLGFGQHLEHLLKEDPVKTLKLTRLMIILEAISLWTWTLPKFPVAILIVRLFGTHKKLFGMVFYIPIGLLTVLVTVLTVITFVQCDPVAKNWNPPLPGQCWDPRIYLYLGYLTGALSAAIDFAFAIYPAVKISKLQMERPRKILVAVSLGLGIPAGITTCYKLSTIATLVNQHDPTWATIPLEVWNSVESCALILAAAIPMSRPILVLIGKNIRELASRITDSSRGSGSNTSSSNIKYIGPESTSYSSRESGYGSRKPAYVSSSRTQAQNLSRQNNNSEEILLEDTAQNGQLRGPNAV